MNWRNWSGLAPLLLSFCARAPPPHKREMAKAPVMCLSNRRRSTGFEAGGSACRLPGSLNCTSDLFFMFRAPQRVRFGSDNVVQAKDAQSRSSPWINTLSLRGESLKHSLLSPHSRSTRNIPASTGKIISTISPPERARRKHFCQFASVLCIDATLPASRGTFRLTGDWTKVGLPRNGTPSNTRNRRCCVWKRSVRPFRSTGVASKSGARSLLDRTVS